MKANWQNNVIALTGSIGSGKSTALKIFSDLGAFTVSADELAKQVSTKGSIGLKKIVEFFGESYLTQASELDRNKLAKIVFSNPAKKKALEEILHPLIQKLAAETFKSAFKKNYPLYIYEIPLLFETGQEKSFKKVVVVTAPKELCIERYLARSSSTREEASRRMDNQMPVEKKVSSADFVIENNGSLRELESKVSACFDQLSR